jgi:hypothetical protein
MRSLLFLLCIALSLHSAAQTKKSIALLPNVTCVSLDTAIVRPSSIQVVYKNEILKSGYRYTVHAQILLRDTLFTDTLWVKFETIDLPFNAFMQSYEPQFGRRDFFQFGQIQAPTIQNSYDAICCHFSVQYMIVR